MELPWILAFELPNLIVPDVAAMWDDAEPYPRFHATAGSGHHGRADNTTESLVPTYFPKFSVEAFKSFADHSIVNDLF